MGEIALQGGRLFWSKGGRGTAGSAVRGKTAGPAGYLMVPSICRLLSDGPIKLGALEGVGAIIQWHALGRRPAFAELIGGQGRENICRRGQRPSMSIHTTTRTRGRKGKKIHTCRGADRLGLCTVIFQTLAWYVHTTLKIPGPIRTRKSSNVGRD